MYIVVYGPASLIAGVGAVDAGVDVQALRAHRLRGRRERHDVLRDGRGGGASAGPGLGGAQCDLVDAGLSAVNCGLAERRVAQLRLGALRRLHDPPGDRSSSAPPSVARRLGAVERRQPPRRDTRSRGPASASGRGRAPDRPALDGGGPACPRTRPQRGSRRREAVARGDQPLRSRAPARAQVADPVAVDGQPRVGRRLAVDGHRDLPGLFLGRYPGSAFGAEHRRRVGPGRQIELARRRARDDDRDARRAACFAASEWSLRAQPVCGRLEEANMEAAR